jgi:hypothetical protein
VLVDIFHLARLLEARCRCVSCARAKVEGGRPLCVGASYRGNVCMCFYHRVMRNLAVKTIKICNVVATPGYSSLQFIQASVISI